MRYAGGTNTAARVPPAEDSFLIGDGCQPPKTSLRNRRLRKRAVQEERAFARAEKRPRPRALAALPRWECRPGEEGAASEAALEKARASATFPGSRQLERRCCGAILIETSGAARFKEVVVHLPIKRREQRLITEQKPERRKSRPLSRGKEQIIKSEVRTSGKKNH